MTAHGRSGTIQLRKERENWRTRESEKFGVFERSGDVGEKTKKKNTGGGLRRTKGRILERYSVYIEKTVSRAASLGRGWKEPR